LVFVACGGIFKVSRGEYVGNFSTFFGIQHTLYVELMVFILAIRYALLKDFQKLWLECDFSLLCQVFGLDHMIPWTLKGKQCKCLQISATMDFRVMSLGRVIVVLID